MIDTTVHFEDVRDVVYFANGGVITGSLMIILGAEILMVRLRVVNDV